MNASIRKRCDCPKARWSRCGHPWRIRVSAGFDPITRRRRELSATVEGSWRDAQREARTLLDKRERRRGADHDESRRTLEEYLAEKWLPAVSKVSKRGRELAPTTRRKYADVIKRVSGVIGHVPLGELRPEHVEHLRDTLGAEGLAPQTVADHLRVLAQALRKPAARGWTDSNPAAPEQVQRPIGEPADLPIIDAELAGKILEAVHGGEWDAPVHLALGCTLRREEVLGLRWEDIDLEAGTLSVRQALTFADGELHDGPPKSRAGERELDLPGFVTQALVRHRREQDKRRMLLGEAWQSDGRVIDRGDGGRVSPPTFSTRWVRFARAQGFHGVTFHGLRHGAATLMLAAGVPDPVAVEIMGHADARILARYQKVVHALRRDAAHRMEDLLGKSAAKTATNIGEGTDVRSVSPAN